MKRLLYIVIFLTVLVFSVVIGSHFLTIKFYSPGILEVECSEEYIYKKLIDINSYNKWVFENDLRYFEVVNNYNSFTIIDLLEKKKIYDIKIVEPKPHVFLKLFLVNYYDKNDVIKLVFIIENVGNKKSRILFSVEKIFPNTIFGKFNCLFFKSDAEKNINNIKNQFKYFIKKSIIKEKKN